MSANPSAPAIFIHGISPRAGTNYLRWLLSCHADVEVSRRGIWEFPHFVSAPHLLAYADQLLHSPKVPGLDRAALLGALGEGLLGLIREGLDAKTRALLKEPSVDGLRHFFDFFPNSSLLILIRDGRDIAASLTRTSFGDLPTPWHRRLKVKAGLEPVIGEHARRWAETSAFIAGLSAQPGPWQDRCTVVRYEDLVRDLRSNLSTLLGRLQLDPSRFDWDAATRLPIKGSSFVGAEDPKAGLNWQGVDRDKVDFDSVGRWKRWPERDLRAFDAIAGAELERWGYARHV